MRKQIYKIMSAILSASLFLECAMPFTAKADSVSVNSIDETMDSREAVSENSCSENSCSENQISPEEANGWFGWDFEEEEENAPAKMNITKVTALDYQTIEISFDPIYEADGYELYRAEKDGQMKLLATLSSWDESYKDTTTIGSKVKTGVIYEYQIRGYFQNYFTGKVTYGEFSEIKSCMTSLSAPTLSSAKAKGVDAIELTYTKVDGATGYRVYGKQKEETTFQAIGTVDGGDALSFTHSGVSFGKEYNYKVCALRKDGTLEVASDDSNVVSASTKLGVTTIVTISQVSYKSQKISFQKVDGATGYVIYRSTKKSSGYKKIGTLKKGTSISYTDKKCTVGTKYFYKVKAYTTINGKKVYGDYSKAKSAKTTLLAPELTQAQALGLDTVSLAWKKVKGASGYTVYRSTAKKGTYTEIGSVDGNKTVTATITGQENGFDYYYKVKAFYKKGKKKIYGKESKSKAVAFKYYTYANESYYDKAKRVFGTQYYNKYPNQAVAQQHMTTITINVWDIAPGGGKVTKQRSLTVNAAIAPSVQKIFQEIYEGQEKFPIKSIGGYSWRGNNSYSEHCDGLAIDINPNENYMIEGNGTISSGSLWAPGVNAYSIPANGEVVKIFKKYGFGWGGDGWSSGRHDYMHFSYFGN